MAKFAAAPHTGVVTPRCPNGHFVVSKVKCLVCGTPLAPIVEAIDGAVDGAVDGATPALDDRLAALDVALDVKVDQADEAVSDAAAKLTSSSLYTRPTPAGGLDDILSRVPSSVAKPVAEKAFGVAASGEEWRKQWETRANEQRKKLETLASSSPQLQAMYDRLDAKVTEVSARASGTVDQFEASPRGADAKHVGEWVRANAPEVPAKRPLQGPPGAPTMPLPTAIEHGHTARHGARAAWGTPAPAPPTGAPIRNPWGRGRGTPPKKSAGGKTVLIIMLFVIALIGYGCISSIIDSGNGDSGQASRTRRTTTLPAIPLQPVAAPEQGSSASESLFLEDSESGTQIEHSFYSDDLWQGWLPLGVDVRPDIDTPSGGVYRDTTWVDPDGSGYVRFQIESTPTPTDPLAFISTRPDVGDSEFLAPEAYDSELIEFGVYNVSSLTSSVSDARAGVIGGDDYKDAAILHFPGENGLMVVTIVDDDWSDVIDRADFYATAIEVS